MPSHAALVVTALATTLSAVRATTLTLNNYVKFSDGSAKYNPPTCAMPYESLDLTRITAWGEIWGDQDPKCGSCAKVCGAVGCEYLLIVDQCTKAKDHLDISTVIGPKIVGSDTGNWDVKMELVDVKFCAGIWNGQMFWDWQKPNANLQKLKDLGGGKSAPGIFAPGNGNPQQNSTHPKPTKEYPGKETSKVPPVTSTKTSSPTTTSYPSQGPPDSYSSFETQVSPTDSASQTPPVSTDQPGDNPPPTSTTDTVPSSTTSPPSQFTGGASKGIEATSNVAISLFAVLALLL